MTETDRAVSRALLAVAGGCFTMALVVGVLNMAMGPLAGPPMSWLATAGWVLLVAYWSHRWLARTAHRLVRRSAEWEKRNDEHR